MLIRKHYNHFFCKQITQQQTLIYRIIFHNFWSAHISATIWENNSKLSTQNIYYKKVSEFNFSVYVLSKCSTLLFIFYFLLHKVLVLCKFSTSGFWWIYTFWNVMNTIWLFLENFCLSVCVLWDKKFVVSVAQDLYNRL